jgi:AraC-like DNA-binding protein
MSRTNQFSLQGWRVLLADLGINSTNVMRRAGLPDDFLSREDPRVETDAFLRIVEAIDTEAKDPFLPLRIAGALSIEAFDPAIFAACCSENLNQALRRLSTFKRLICPMRLDVEINEEYTQIEPHWLLARSMPHSTWVITEMLFFVALARMGTRSQVVPLAIEVPEPPENQDPYIEYIGIRITQSDQPQVRFAAADAERPFLIANHAMWKFFEPELRRRLEQLEADATHSERVRAALLECLPSGRSSADEVAKKLGMSKRTLQRRLQSEEQSFQSILDHTREELARHYLGSSQMSGAEISFMLGYEDPNSFFRAFHTWTGETPESVRSQLRH